MILIALKAPLKRRIKALQVLPIALLCHPWGDARLEYIE
jgi:hypothetical protein